MAVLFPVQQGQFLKADRPAELLQGYLNIMNAEGSTNGQLTKAQVDSYSQKQFFALDPNGNVGGYLKNNFSQIAALDGNANSISTDDLVQLRQGLPPVPVTPPPAYPPSTGTPSGAQPQILQIFQMMMQLMMQLFSRFSTGQR
ncbi:MAG TPA: hypothetical protein V6C52_02170 [Coleofasciculaceae cyanobacterium]|jgi:hypothetical protein